MYWETKTHNPLEQGKCTCHHRTHLCILSRHHADVGNAVQLAHALACVTHGGQECCTTCLVTMGCCMVGLQGLCQVALAAMQLGKSE